MTLAAGTIFDIDFASDFLASDGDFFDVVIGGTFDFSDLSVDTFDFSDALGIDWGTSIATVGNGQKSVRLSASVVVGPVLLPASAFLLLGGLAGLFSMARIRRKRV